MNGISATPYGMIPPSDLDLLTRFHPLNERSLLADSKAQMMEENNQAKPLSGAAGNEDTKKTMKGVKKINKAGGGGRGRGRARIQQADCIESFIAGQIANLGYNGFGSLSSCGTTRNDASEAEESISAIDDLSLDMKGVSVNEKGTEVEAMKIKRARGRGRRIQKD